MSGAVTALIGVVVGSVLTYFSQGADRRRAEAIALRVLLAHGRRLMYANHSSRTDLFIHFRELYVRVTGLASTSAHNATSLSRLATLLWQLADKCWYSSLAQLLASEGAAPGLEAVRLAASPGRDLLEAYAECEGMVDGILKNISRRPASTALFRRDAPGVVELDDRARRWTELLLQHGGASPDISAVGDPMSEQASADTSVSR